MDLKAVVSSSLCIHHQELKIRQSLSEKELARRMVSWMMWACWCWGGVVCWSRKNLALSGLVRLVAALILLSGASMALYGVLAAVRDGVRGSTK